LRARIIAAVQHELARLGLPEADDDVPPVISPPDVD
jgi:hypothetical protein